MHNRWLTDMRAYECTRFLYARNSSPSPRCDTCLASPVLDPGTPWAVPKNSKGHPEGQSCCDTSGGIASSWLGKNVTHARSPRLPPVRGPHAVQKEKKKAIIIWLRQCFFRAESVVLRSRWSPSEGEKQGLPSAPDHGTSCATSHPWAMVPPRIIIK
jgi:hypothetical protein